MTVTDLRPAAQVLGVEVDAIDMEGALAHIAKALRESTKGYVCVAGVHGVMEAQRSRLIAQIYAGSEMTVPDGMPLVWVGQLQGHTNMQRVTGPDLMLEIFRRKEFSHVTHFLYGGVEGIADELRDKFSAQFPWAKIVGTCTPPFHELSSLEEGELITRISELKPDILWIGIGCPKQEIFMSRYLPLLDTKLLFGVGAAFDFHTGRIRDCDDWVKRAGLQWLHRLLQDPKRLWRRYLRNNPVFLWQIALQLTGLRQYTGVLPSRMSDKQPHPEAKPG